MPLFLNYSQESKDGIVYPIVQLLLANKILSYSERIDKLNGKAESDLLDIMFCMEKMVLEDLKMPKTLKSLYSYRSLNCIPHSSPCPLTPY